MTEGRRQKEFCNGGGCPSFLVDHAAQGMAWKCKLGNREVAQSLTPFLNHSVLPGPNSPFSHTAQRKLYHDLKVGGRSGSRVDSGDNTSLSEQ